MRKIKNLKGFNPQFSELTTDLVINKTGLEVLNGLPDTWELNQAGTILWKKNDFDTKVIIAAIAQWKAGNEAKWNEDVNIEIADIKLMRLNDITENMAKRTGVEETSPGVWKHYAPEIFYPKAVLKTQFPGFPNFNTALGSFHSLWCKNFGILEIYANPWIWLFTCKRPE